MPKYDLAVIGAGLGGLAAAALASRKGRKVLVLEPSEEIGGSLSEFKKEGFTFFTGPAITFGAEQGGVLQRMYADHGIAHGAKLVSPCYQVLLPDKRITVYPQREATFEELRREFPGEIDNIIRFYKDASKISEKTAKSRFYSFVYSRENAGRHVKRYGFSRELFQFFNSQSLFFYHQPVDGISLSSLAFLLGAPAMQMRGGFMKLAHQMSDVILQNRGEVRFKEPWPGISPTRGRLAVLAASTGRIEADAILFNTRQMPDERTVFFGIKEEVIPVGMANEVVSISDYKKPEELLYLSVSSPHDEASAPKGTRALTVTRLFLRGRQVDNGAVAVHLGCIVPFLKDFTLFTHVHKPAERSYPFEEAIKFKPIRHVSTDHLLMKSSYRNVYLLSDEAGSSAQAVGAAEYLEGRLK